MISVIAGLALSTGSFRDNLPSYGQLEIMRIATQVLLSGQPLKHQAIFSGQLLKSQATLGSQLLNGQATLSCQQLESLH